VTYIRPTKTSNLFSKQLVLILIHKIWTIELVTKDY
jgi:hypothetical protein